VPVHWKTKYENADLNLETIPELTGYFTRLEDLDRRKEKIPTKLKKVLIKTTRMKRIGINPGEETMERQTISPVIKAIPSIAPSTSPTHMTPVNARPKRIRILSKQIKVIKR
jgi:hypothetical protein